MPASFSIFLALVSVCSLLRLCVFVPQELSRWRTRLFEAERSLLEAIEYRFAVHHPYHDLMLAIKRVFEKAAAEGCMSLPS